MYSRINHYKLLIRKNYRNHVIKGVLDFFFDQIKIPKRKQNAETFFQRELLRYVLLFIINFYEQFLKVN